MSAANSNRRPALAWRLAIAVAAASAVAACQGDRITTGSVPLSVEARHPIQVSSEEVILDLPVGHGGMSAAERGAVGDFVTAYRREGYGTFEILGPSGTPNEVASQRVIGEVRQMAYSGGIPATAVSYAAYRPKHAKAPVVLRYHRYAASASCGQWPTDLDKDWRNVPYENFGCATQSNLAAMVADPRDLHGPRGMTPRDSERRDVVFDNYRRGQPTSARTAIDDAGTASDVGN